MDIPPHKVMRSIQYGLKNPVLGSDTIWVCASCETCTTRCPNGIDIAHVMDTLRQISRREHIPASKKDVPIFHSTFNASMKRWGRVHEMEMAALYTLKSAGLSGLIKQSRLGWEMLRKGKIKFLPYRILGHKGVRNIFNQTEKKG